jgi:hypothetical protein
MVNDSPKGAWVVCNGSTGCSKLIVELVKPGVSLTQFNFNRPTFEEESY